MGPHIGLMSGRDAGASRQAGGVPRGSWQGPGARGAGGLNPRT